MEIHVLSNETINKIAAGEVIERPINVAKELIENSIDAGATAISVEIKDGGVSLIRVSDNGCGIEPDQITKAFRRHATSKINDSDDLERLTTLGFRGEALSSIAAVSEVEMITKVSGALDGVRATNAGLHPNDTDVIPLEVSEVGAPDGTTVIVRNLFYNVPVRRKFLKTAATEGGYISDLMEHMALSHPDISFHYRINGKEKLHTSGNGNIKEIIYRIYGREIAKTLLQVKQEDAESGYRLDGYIGRPEISRGSRSFEIFFVNGRILESDVLSHGLESGYRTDLMQHQFPFAVLYLTIPQNLVDVNIHPAKREVRFSDSQKVYEFIDRSVFRTLHKEELIPRATLQTGKEIREEEQKEKEALAGEHIEPFEIKKTGRPSPEYSGKPETAALPEDAEEDSFFSDYRPEWDAKKKAQKDTDDINIPDENLRGEETLQEEKDILAEKNLQEKKTLQDVESLPDGKNFPEAGIPIFAGGDEVQSSEQLSFFDAGEDSGRILTKEKAEDFTFIGQLFKTYWIIQSGDRCLMIDQHAAHEKVRFERLMKQYKKRVEEKAPSQNLLPPIVLTLSAKEETVYLEHRDFFEALGYEIEEFGDGSYTVRAVPLELYGDSPEELIHDALDEMMNGKMSGDPSDIIYRIATESCKGAIKGDMEISTEEAKALIAEMLTLDNPYHCPHGRPTCIILTKQEIEKKFKRIV